MFLNYRRSSVAYILLSIFTLGFYGAHFRAEAARDFNIAQGKNVQSIPNAKFVLLNLVTFGIYATLWDIEFIERSGEYIEENGGEYAIDLEAYRFYGFIPFVRFRTVPAFVEHINLFCRIYSDKELEDTDISDITAVKRVNELTDDVDKIYVGEGTLKNTDLDFSKERAENESRNKNSEFAERELDIPTRTIAGHAVVEEYDPSKDVRRIGYQMRFEREGKTETAEAEKSAKNEREEKKRLRKQAEEEKKQKEELLRSSYRNKKWLVKALSLMLLVFAVPIVAIFVTVFALPSVYEDTYMGALYDKYELLKESDSKKRIIIIGGDGTALGIDSELMESELKGYDVINLGFSSELGIKAMLDLSKDGIKKNDIIIIAPDISEKGMSLDFNGEAMLKALDGNIELLAHIDISDYPSLLGASLEFACNKLGYVFDGTLPTSSRTAYLKENFNENGDNACGRPYNETFGLYNKVHFSYKAKLNGKEETEYDKFIAYVNKYVHYAERKGATVYYSFGAVCEAAIDESVTEKDIDAYYSNLCSVLQCKIISDVKNYILDEQYFYDSEFTLNDSGVALRTVKLIDDLKRTLGKDTETSNDGIIDAGYLVFPSVSESEEDKKNAEYFVFEPYALVSGGETFTYYSVTGLSESGKNAKELTVPNTYNGRPVIRISPYAFKDGKNLKTLHIGSSVSVIDGYAFASSDITSVYIPSGKKPQDINIPTGNALAIADASPLLTFYVDASVLEAFQNDFGFWSCYKEHLASA